MEKKTIFAALAALVGLGWLFRKGDTTTGTIPGFTPPTVPASTAATGSNPLIIVTTQNATSDTTVSNPAPTATTYSTGGASFGAGTANTQITTDAQEAEAAAAHAAFRSGAPAPAGWRYTPMGPVRI